MLASGKPAYKSQEDYYDEILELRQVIKDLKSENGIMKTKLQRVLQENLQKVSLYRNSFQLFFLCVEIVLWLPTFKQDREIKDYLNPSKQVISIKSSVFLMYVIK